MKPLHSFFAVMTLSVCLATEDPLSTTKSASVQGVFTGTTPCGQMIRPLHKVTQEADCALVQWKLTLYHNPVTLEPTTYKLSSVNRFIVKGTNMYSEPGTKSEREGKWTIVRDTKTYPNFEVYRLESDKPVTSITFLKLSDKLIHILDNKGGLMIGNESWSYTLSRVEN